MPFENRLGGQLGALRQPKVVFLRPKGVRQGVGQAFFHVSALWGDRKPGFHCVVLVVVRPGMSLDIVCCVAWGPGPKDQL